MLFYRNNPQNLASDIKNVVIAAACEVIVVWMSLCTLKLFGIRVMLKLQKVVFGYLVNVDNENDMTVADKLARIPEILALKSIISSDMLQFIEGLVQSVACFGAGLIIEH